MKSTNKIICLIFLIPIVLIAIVFGVAANQNNSRITMHENYIEFDALTYDKVFYEDIEDIKFLNEWTIHGNKDGVGFSYHNYFSGEAYIENIGKCRAYVYFKKDYCVVLKAKNIIAFNLNSKQETEELYEMLLNKVEVLKHEK